MSSISKFNEDSLSSVANDKSEKKTPFPYKITKLDDETNKELMKCFTGRRGGFVQVGPKKWLFGSGYEKAAQHCYNFKVRPDDIFIVTFPRSGTTWTQEMVWLLANGLNYQKAAEIPLEKRFPFLEFTSVVHNDFKTVVSTDNTCDEKYYKDSQILDIPAWQFLSESTGQRLIKTHLPFSLLPPNLLEVGTKVVYVARNPKDVAVSYYHLSRLLKTSGYTGDFSTYWDYFVKNLITTSPYWEHIKEGWSRRNEKNVLFLFYEDMNKDLRDVIQKVSRFLGKNYTNEEYAALENHLKIDNFRKNQSVNGDIYKYLGITVSGEEGFVRKGKSGSWKDYFDEKLNSSADKWIEENLKDTDLRFPNVPL